VVAVVVMEVMVAAAAGSAVVAAVSRETSLAIRSSRDHVSYLDDADMNRWMQSNRAMQKCFRRAARRGSMERFVTVIDWFSFSSGLGALFSYKKNAMYVNVEAYSQGHSFVREITSWFKLSGTLYMQSRNFLYISCIIVIISFFFFFLFSLFFLLFLLFLLFFFFFYNILF